MRGSSIQLFLFPRNYREFPREFGEGQIPENSIPGGSRCVKQFARFREFCESTSFYAYC